MRWVVIGSSGYIGSALCRHLVQAGMSVLSVSRRESAPARCEHRQIKVFDAESFADVFQAGDIVVYAAGLASANACRKNPQLASVLNCRLPVELLAVADDRKAAQFLYLSSIKAVTAPKGVIATEEGGEPARDPYGGSKWSAEQLLLSRKREIRVNVLRPAAVYGNAAGATTTSEASTAKRAILWKTRLRAWCRVLPLLPATGYRSFVALEDLIQAIVGVGNSACCGETFIIAEPSYYNLASIGSAASGRRIKSSRNLTRLALLPFRCLAVLGVKSGVLDIEQSELYSAARLKAQLNWQPSQRYSRFLGEK